MIFGYENEQISFAIVDLDSCTAGELTFTSISEVDKRLCDSFIC